MIGVHLLLDRYATLLFFRSPVRLVISSTVVNGERARWLTPAPWQPRRPVFKLPLRGKPLLISNVQGRSRLAPGDRSLAWFPTTPP
ncbi:hypothetical protein OH773_07100 [Buttiauxella sp. WJP83]|uniref:hypothetical protein n=1 Tax=Buttiauxella sp. WJP83 TaxID=2986951 RepID=UPI0022DE93E4|nr:hypothetical protein [Buttiauxella sp. WJP83]WBM72002.1 hypothetical protein OH773_07100 [Buttiauxella sp. WJP83]